MHIRLTALFCSVFICLAYNATVGASPGPLKLGNYHALLISNQNYKYLRSLKTPHNDTDRLAKLLRAEYGFKVTQIKDGDRRTILNKLDSLVERLTPDDNLLIYYAGHGHLDKATGQGYWLPSTAKANRRSEWVSNKDITDTLRAMNAFHVMIISDSCFSGTLTRSTVAGLQAGSTKEQYYAKLAEHKSRTALTSGGTEPVDDSGARGNSVFANALAVALERNDKQLLEGEALYNLVKRPVALNSSAIQKPTYSDVRATGHDDGDFLFFRADAPRSISSGQQAQPAGNTLTVDPAVIEVTFWDTIKDSTDAADFQAYLQRYPNGQFASLARLRLRKFSVPVKGVQTSKAAPQQLAKLSPAPAVQSGNAAPGLVFVVRATPDSEYAPKFTSRRQYSERIAQLITGVLREGNLQRRLTTLTDSSLSRDLLFESGRNEVSQRLCTAHQANAVLLLELNMTRDMDEITRSPDEVVYYYYDCNKKRKLIKQYPVAFQRGESFTYAASLRQTVNRFRREVVPLQ